MQYRMAYLTKGSKWKKVQDNRERVAHGERWCAKCALRETMSPCSCSQLTAAGASLGSVWLHLCSSCGQDTQGYAGRGIMGRGGGKGRSVIVSSLAPGSR